MSEDLERVADLALAEVTRRLQKEVVKDIPDHVLAKYFEFTNRTIERRQTDDEEESKPFDLKDELATVPRSRGLKLAKVERDRLLAEARWYQEWIDGEDSGLPDREERGPLHSALSGTDPGAR